MDRSLMEWIYLACVGLGAFVYGIWNERQGNRRGVRKEIKPVADQNDLILEQLNITHRMLQGVRDDLTSNHAEAMTGVTHLESTVAQLKGETKDGFDRHGVRLGELEKGYERLGSGLEDVKARVARIESNQDRVDAGRETTEGRGPGGTGAARLGDPGPPPQSPILSDSTPHVKTPP